MFLSRVRLEAVSAVAGLILSVREIEAKVRKTAMTGSQIELNLLIYTLLHHHLLKK